DLRLGEITELEKEYRQAVEDKGMTAKEAGKLIGELKDEQGELVAKSEELAGEYDRTMKVIEEATRNGVNMSRDALQEWIEKNSELLDSMNETYAQILDITTNAFSKISEKSKVTKEEMFENLKHNQEMTAQWADNIAELYEYASKNGHDGFLHWLEQLGPDSAAEVAVISSMSDKELKDFATLMDNGAEQAGDNFKTSLGKGMEKAFE